MSDYIYESMRKFGFLLNDEFISKDKIASQYSGNDESKAKQLKEKLLGTPYM